MIRIGLLLTLLLYCTVCMGGGCFNKLVDRSKEEGGKMAVSAGETKMEKEAPGSTGKEPLLDDTGQPVFDANGEQVMVYRTTIVDDILCILNGGGGWASLLQYIVALAFLFLGKLLGVKTATKKIGKVMDLKDIALKHVTSKINTMAGESKYGEAYKWLTGVIGTQMPKHTAAGAVLHKAVKESEHKRVPVTG